MRVGDGTERSGGDRPPRCQDEAGSILTDAQTSGPVFNGSHDSAGRSRQDSAVLGPTPPENQANYSGCPLRSRADSPKLSVDRGFLPLSVSRPLLLTLHRSVAANFAPSSLFLSTRHVFCKDGSCNCYQQPPSRCYKSSQGIACRLTFSFAPSPWLIGPRPCIDIKQGSTPAFEAILGRIGSPHDNTQPSIRDLLRCLGQEISTVGPSSCLGHPRYFAQVRHWLSSSTPCFRSLHPSPFAWPGSLPKLRRKVASARSNPKDLRSGIAAYLIRESLDSVMGWS